MPEFDNFQDLKKEVTEKETDKKCPNCGATVVYNSALRKMHCEYCGYESEIIIDDTQNDVVELDFASAVNRQSCEWGVEKKSVECKNCGAVSIYDALETAAVCPFCGSTHVMPAATENTISPGGVCPFTITKETAVENFKKWLKKQLFAPRKAKKTASPKAFKGAYLPYWTFDTNTSSEFTARAGYDSTERDRDGKTTTTTTWRRVNGEYYEFIDDETVMASKRHEESGVKKCEPFQLSKVIPYNPKVLAGFVAERYSIGLEDGWNIAQKQIHDKLDRNIRDYVKHHWSCDRVDRLKFNTHFADITYKYILVPVWISSFQYKDKIYQFAVNGQTGKVGGKTPISVFRVIIAILIAAGIIWGLIALNN